MRKLLQEIVCALSLHRWRVRSVTDTVGENTCLIIHWHCPHCKKRWAEIVPD